MIHGLVCIMIEIIDILGIMHVNCLFPAGGFIHVQLYIEPEGQNSVLKTRGNYVVALRATSFEMCVALTKSR